MEIHKIPWFQTTNQMRRYEISWNIMWYDEDFMVYFMEILGITSGNFLPCAMV